MYPNYIKRVLDLIISVLALVASSPIFLSVWLLLAVANRGNSFFTQLRPGRNEVFFKVIKFKTMRDQRDPSGDLLTDNQRLTDRKSVV